MYSSLSTYEFEDIANRLRKVLHNVLKAPDHLQYQLAFLSSVCLTWIREDHLATDHGQSQGTT